MPDQPRLSGRTALVTGASGGLGEAFARGLAERGVHLVLVARSADRLEALASDLRRAEPSLRVETVPADLTRATAARELYDHVQQLGMQVDLLLNDAGSAVHGAFADTPVDRSLLQVDLNVRALVEITGRFLPAMVKNARGWVVNVASTAAYQPLPDTAVYAASKSFVRSFTEALRFELRGSGVRALAVAPGPMQTGFFRAAGAEYLTKGRMRPASVAAFTLARLDGSTPVIIPGLRNKAVLLGERLAPRRLLVRGAARATRVRQ